MRKGRIVGQCNQADFVAIEHLAEITEKPDQLDVSTLSRSQRLAFQFLQVALRRNIHWNLIREVVKEVLFWGEGDTANFMQVRFKQRVSDKVFVGKALQFQELWNK